MLALSQRLAKVAGVLQAEEFFVELGSDRDDAGVGRAIEFDGNGEVICAYDPITGIVEGRSGNPRKTAAPI